MFIRPGIDLSQIDAVIWDYDGVHYDYEALPDREFYHRCDAAAARAACALIPGMSFDEAVSVCQRSYELHHDTVTEFIPYAEKAGLTIEDLKTGLFHVYHEGLMADIRHLHHDFFTPQTEMIAAFENLPEVRHCIATHSCADRWAKPAREMQGMKKYIPDEGIFGFAEFGFRSKSRYPDAVQMALDYLGTLPERTAFVEDSTKHLLVAKEHFPRIVTVLKTDGDPDIAPEKDIDVVVRRPAHFINAMAAMRKPGPAPAMAFRLG